MEEGGRVGHWVKRHGPLLSYWEEPDGPELVDGARTVPLTVKPVSSEEWGALGL